MSTFEVGALVVRRHGTKHWRTRVKRVTKRFVEMKDGSCWNHDGHPYPKQEWSQEFAIPWDILPKNEQAAILREIMLRRLNGIGWDEFTDEQLAQLLGTIDAMKKTNASASAGE